jgi:predicted DNA-binding protein
MANNLTITFSKRTSSALEAAAARQNRTPTDIVAEAVGSWLEDEEDVRIAEERIAEYEREGGVPHEEVMRERGLKLKRKRGL